MARGTLTFRQRDLVRALKGAKAAGIEVAQVEIDKAGKIVIVTGRPTIEQTGTGDDINEWDQINGHNQNQTRQRV
jgi:hypothetical protein